MFVCLPCLLYIYLYFDEEEFKRNEYNSIEKYHFYNIK